MKEFDVQGKVNVDGIRCPDMSVNRGNYSGQNTFCTPVFLALLPSRSLNFRLGKFPTRYVRETIESLLFELSMIRQFYPVHLDETYAHSEIRAFDGAERKKSVSEVVLKQYRMRLRRVMVPGFNIHDS